MHILFIPAWLSIDKKDEQLGSFFIEQAQALNAQGVTVRILYLERIGLKKTIIFFKNLFLGRLVKKQTDRKGVICIVHLFFDLLMSKYNNCSFRDKYLKHIKDYIIKYGVPDVIHIQSMVGLHDLPVQIKSKFNINIVITEHASGYILNKPTEDIFYKNIYVADRFFAVSNFYANYLNGISLVKKIEVMPNNLSETVLDNKYNNVKKREKFTFINVGNLYDIKRQNLLISEFIKLINNNIDAELLIVGEGKNKNKLKKIIKENKMEKCIKLCGKKGRSETLDLISSSHVLVVSSLIETFSVVTIEAFALKTLVVSTNCGGPQMLINNDNGILCDSNNLSEAMVCIYKNYDKYDLNKVREYVLSNFSPKIIAGKLEKVYQEVVVSS